MAEMRKEGEVNFTLLRLTQPASGHPLRSDWSRRSRLELRTRSLWGRVPPNYTCDEVTTAQGFLFYYLYVRFSLLWHQNDVREEMQHNCTSSMSAHSGGRTCFVLSRLLSRQTAVPGLCCHAERFLTASVHKMSGTRLGWIAVRGVQTSCRRASHLIRWSSEIC